MTELTDKQHKAQMEDMKSFDEQMPCVGIFWYDPEDHTLFGVRKKELTPQMVEDAAGKGVPIRKMVGLILLKNIYDLSDEEGVARWDGESVHVVLHG